MTAWLDTQTGPGRGGRGESEESQPCFEPQYLIPQVVRNVHIQITLSGSFWSDIINTGLPLYVDLKKQGRSLEGGERKTAPALLKTICRVKNTSYIKKYNRFAEMFEPN